jgi:cytochrome bd-type quinol oxidase subunit 2
MDLNTNFLLLIIGIALAISAGFAFVIARTAKSKGYSFGWFFFFGFVSYLLASVVTVFLKPKGEQQAKPKLSSLLLLVTGIIVEFGGLSLLPNLDPSLSNEQAVHEFSSSSQVMGGLFVAIAGILIIMGSVANDYRGGETKQVRQL